MITLPADLMLHSTDGLSQLTHLSFWRPAVYATLFYGVRYLLVATLFFLLARGRWGRAHGQATSDIDGARHVRRELGHSACTVIVFGAVNAALFALGWNHATRIYLHFSDFPLWWFWLSIAALLLIHDTLFYWMHRAMHLPVLFAKVHRVHHLSVHPTAYAAYSFHPWEAFGEAIIVTVIVYLIPVHPLAFLIFQTVSTLYNAYGHCGREFYPPGMADHWLGRWINTSTLHALHHARGQGNYGLYFMFWDRWMQTARAPA